MPPGSSPGRRGGPRTPQCSGNVTQGCQKGDRGRSPGLPGPPKTKLSLRREHDFAKMIKMTRRFESCVGACSSEAPGIPSDGKNEALACMRARFSKNGHRENRTRKCHQGIPNGGFWGVLDPPKRCSRLHESRVFTCRPWRVPDAPEGPPGGRPGSKSGIGVGPAPSPSPPLIPSY